MAFIHQGLGLIDWMTKVENIAPGVGYALRRSGHPALPGPARQVWPRATLRDVSVLAGPSRILVTAVFIRAEQVLPETRVRVQQATATPGCVLDRATSSLATRRSGFVGLILPTGSGNQGVRTVDVGFTIIVPGYGPASGTV